MRTQQIKANGKEYLVLDSPQKVAVTIKEAYCVIRQMPFSENEPVKIIGKYTRIGFVRNLTEKEWAGIAERICAYKPFYFDYTEKLNHFWTATESGKSLLEANGIDDTWSNPYLLEIKK